MYDDAIVRQDSYVVCVSLFCCCAVCMFSVAALGSALFEAELSVCVSLGTCTVV